MPHCLIIAEAGVNHNGNIALAKKLVDVAVDAGADIVKFQTFKASKLASKVAKKADYQQVTTGASESQFEMLKRLELKPEMHDELIAYCNQKNIQFLSTPFDSDSAIYLKNIGVTIGKIPSGEITNLPYLQTMAGCFPEIILSTGMSDLSEVEQAISVLIEAGAKKENIAVLHCNTEYPTPMEDVNLLAMLTMKKQLGVTVGYSDHTPGIEVPVAAVAMGASVIEKHFTLDKSMEGPDHKASLEPTELVAMVKAIRNIEKAIGDGEKKPSPSETKNKNIARKSIVAARDLKKGTVLTEDDLIMKRPGNGISPMRIHEVLGKMLTADVQEDDLLDFSTLQ